jgi:dTDP-4-dehydrorhamnose 3,5-epimerase-like enzyme
MKKLTDEFIDGIHKEMWKEMEKEFGTMYRIPKEQASNASELIRGLHVLQLWQREGGSKNVLSYLNSYSVLPHIADHIIQTYCGKEVQKEAMQKPEKRKDKWGAFMEWAKTQDGKEFTTEQLVEQCGFSYQTTLGFVNETPEFIKVKRGLYRISIAKRPD